MDDGENKPNLILRYKLNKPVWVKFINHVCMIIKIKYTKN